MAKGPAVVIIARHGARLDAADKTWHLTSPTPYDPPLTYGGWAQGKALGLRIAALLHQKDVEKAEGSKEGSNTDPAQTSTQTASSTDKTRGGDGQRPKKKRKIIIHTSPFLRCVQTSTAVAAGISQFRAPTPSTTPQLGVPKPPNAKKASPLANAPTSTTQAPQPKFLKLVADPKHDRAPKPHIGPDKILLRVDAFLGEWLSPDYYEDITPPPNSTLMVAGAKADLLRRGDYIGDQPNTHSSKGHFPGGWMGKAGPKPLARQSTENGAFPTMGNLAEVAPLRERSGSLGSMSPMMSRTALTPAHPGEVPDHIYDPPAPSYSIQSSDSIPRGYVAHAREACVQVDFQWDSMRPPQEWGDGGEYGDEWSTMHKRFRKGLTGMMQWYQKHGTEPPKDHFRGFMFRDVTIPSVPLLGVKHTSTEVLPKLQIPNVKAGEDEDEELVLVLVTHGAGCNALLGAMTNQPVLMDVSLASLSLAVRRSQPRPASTNNTSRERSMSVADPGMSDTYDMKIIASVEHLRPGVDPSKLPQPQSQTQSPRVPPSPTVRNKRFSGSSAINSPIEAPFSVGEPSRIWNSAVSGGVRRSPSAASGHARSASSNVPSSLGMWAAKQSAIADTPPDGRGSLGGDLASNSANSLPKEKPAAATPLATETTHHSISNVDGASDSNELTKVCTHEEKEKADAVAPLFNALTWKPKTQAQGTTGGGGLWGSAKPQTATAKLWGPPRLDDVYEHKSGPKRRWTVTEADKSL